MLLNRPLPIQWLLGNRQQAAPGHLWRLKGSSKMQQSAGQSAVATQSLFPSTPGGPSPYSVPVSVLTDSYKATHFLQYPAAKKMVCYGEFRAGFNKDQEDTRLVAYGIRYIIENHVCRQWTMQDIDQADLFYRSGEMRGSAASGVQHVCARSADLLFAWQDTHGPGVHSLPIPTSTV